MKTKPAILLVGCGNLGRSLLSAWVGADSIAPSYVIQPSLKAASEFGTYPNLKFLSQLEKLPGEFQPDMVVFAVKPQQASLVIPLYQHFASSKTVFASLLAGVSLGWLSQHLGEQAPIVRLMPNLGAQVRQSMTLGVCNSHVSVEQIQEVRSLCEAAGKLLLLDNERLLEAGTPISGSGPAYFFLLTESLTKAAQELGFDEQSADLLATQTLLGSALLVEQAKIKQKTPSTLRGEVSSKGGVTLAALEALNTPDSISERVKNAVLAGIERAKQLAL